MTSSHLKPPRQLEQALEIKPSDWSRKDAYYLLTGLVIPRPLLVAFSSTGEKDTYTNAAETGEFVWNTVSMDIVEQMNFTATDFPFEDSEFEWSGLTAEPSRAVKPKRVAEARAHFECRVAEIVSIGSNRIVIGEVIHIHVALDPACRLSGSWYGRLGELYKVARSTWKDQVEGTRGQQAMPRIDSPGD